MTTSHPAGQCCKNVSRGRGSFRSSQCKKPGILTLGENTYCTVHFPPNVEKRKDAAQAAFKEELARKVARRQRIESSQAELKRKAECFDDLLAALQDMLELRAATIRSEVTEKPELDIVAAARAAIAKATS